METKTGTLYGIGVGPGDPDLLTIKAVKILNRVDVVFAASSIKNTHSLAVDIARPHMSADADVRALPFQMSNNESGNKMPNLFCRNSGKADPWLF
jgi:precorrin-2/cobalt-factor-2 C20-methyltransferase